MTITPMLATSYDGIGQLVLWFLVLAAGTLIGLAGLVCLFVSRWRRFGTIAAIMSVVVSAHLAAWRLVASPTTDCKGIAVGISLIPAGIAVGIFVLKACLQKN